MSKSIAIHSRVIVDSYKKIVHTDWERVSSAKNIYLNISYLKALEEGMEEKMKFFYSISYDKANKPLVISVFQLIEFEDKRKAFSHLICKLGTHVNNKLKDVFKFKVLVSGNVFSDGENGFIWSDNITAETAIKEVDKIGEELRSKWKIKDEASLTLFKEFWPKSTSFSDALKENHYRDFKIDVNMVLEIHPSWQNLDDYLASMTTKYRTRAKSVFKKSKDLKIISLTALDINKNKQVIAELFENVLEKADFSYGILSCDSFINFKKELGDNFIFKALYLKQEMVGFSTAFVNNNSLEAAFVGMDYDHNKNLAVYQRILYDYVDLALSLKKTNLRLGRTAELIKSSIGALPMDMKLYVKHRKTFPNLLLKPLLNSITPSEFEIRKPFKANFIN